MIYPSLIHLIFKKHFKNILCTTHNSRYWRYRAYTIENTDKKYIIKHIICKSDQFHREKSKTVTVDISSGAGGDIKNLSVV